MNQKELLQKIKLYLEGMNVEGVKFLCRLAEMMSEVKKYDASITPEEYAQIEQQEAQERAEKKAREEEERRNRPSPYSLNATMQMLGHQHYFNILTQEAFSAIDDILTARPYTATRETSMDVFMLGYIYGKRAERKRRRKGV